MRGYITVEIYIRVKVANNCCVRTGFFTCHADGERNQARALEEEEGRRTSENSSSRLFLHFISSYQ